MKLHAIIRDTVHLKQGDAPQSVVVEFVSDKEKQHFEVLFYDWCPYREGLRKWDVWELNVKWKSEIFVNPKTQVKSYFTHLFCTKAIPVHQMQK